MAHTLVEKRKLQLYFALRNANGTLVTFIDNGNGTVTYSGTGVVDNGSTFTLTGSNVVDNGNGTFTVTI